MNEPRCCIIFLGTWRVRLSLSSHVFWHTPRGPAAEEPTMASCEQRTWWKWTFLGEINRNQWILLFNIGFSCKMSYNFIINFWDLLEAQNHWTFSDLAAKFIVCYRCSPNASQWLVHVPWFTYERVTILGLGSFVHPLGPCVGRSLPPHVPSRLFLSPYAPQGWGNRRSRRAP